MSLLYVFFAACFAAGANFCLRKNTDAERSSQGYLTIYFLFSFIISCALREIHFSSFSYVMSSIGAMTGLLNFLMMCLLARCIQIGSSGLTFAFQNSASIFPSIALFAIFGVSFGFTLTKAAILGFVLILLGLILATSEDKKNPSYPKFKKWLCYSILVFLLQGCILSLFQWRCLLLQDHPKTHPFIPWQCTASQDAWFIPGFFLIPALLQCLLFLFSEKRWFHRGEVYLGCIGGCANGGATFFLLRATFQATPQEKMILFPLFAISVIFLSNLWSHWIYKEKIHALGLAICFAGVLLGAI